MDANRTTHLTPQQVAHRLGLEVRTIYSHIHAHRLRALDMGTGQRAAWIISEDDLQAFLDSRANPAPPPPATRRRRRRRINVTEYV